MTNGAGPEDDDATTAATKRPNAALSWDDFEHRLAAALGRMADETYLILSTLSKDDGPGYYVQFASGESCGVRAEAVGSSNLPPARALTPAQEEQLEGLGWQRPKQEDVGRNFLRAWPMPAPLEDVARLAVRTLRDVYGISAPAELRYIHSAFGGGTIAEPDLGIEAARPIPPPRPGPRPSQARPELAPLIEDALKRWLRLDELARDGDGDYPIRVGSAVMFVRLLDGVPPVVRIFSPILHDIGESAALLAAVNEINGRIRFGRVFWVDRQVIVAMELTAVDITADQVAFACIELGNLADHPDDGLHGRFGGATAFATRATLVN
ncbi:MAG: YbjN domain-containing protein [Chloroflexota bacterium]